MLISHRGFAGTLYLKYILFIIKFLKGLFLFNYLHLKFYTFVSASEKQGTSVSAANRNIKFICSASIFHPYRDTHSIPALWRPKKGIASALRDHIILLNMNKRCRNFRIMTRSKHPPLADRLDFLTWRVWMSVAFSSRTCHEMTVFWSYDLKDDLLKRACEKNVMLHF